MRDSTLHSPEEFAEAYGTRDWEFYRPIVSMIVEYSRPGMILDVGAGTGLLAECCQRFGMPCVGLEGAHTGAVEGLARGVPMVRARLEAGLPFRDGTFGTVICNQVIEHIFPETAELFFGEAYRVLAPGGALLLQSPSARDPVQAAEPGHVNLYLPSRLRREVQAAGFEILAERNGVLPILGSGRIRGLLTRGLMLATGAQDRLSSSANVVARRPGVGGG